MMHHITINYKPTKSKCHYEEAKGHKFYFCRGLYIDYHKDNDNIIYIKTTVSSLPHSQIKVCNNNYKQRLPSSYFELYVDQAIGNILMTNNLQGIVKISNEQGFVISIYPIFTTYILTGTPSSGKSSIMKELKSKVTKKYQDYDLIDIGINVPQNEFNGHTPNYTQELVKYAGHSILDVVIAQIYPEYYNMLVYTSLDDICQFVAKRRNSDYRASHIFMWYASFYKISEDNMYLDTISRLAFEKSLLTHCKFLFKDLLSLKKLTIELFIAMGIGDDKVYRVIPVHNYDIVITSKSTKARAKEVDSYINRIENKAF